MDNPPRYIRSANDAAGNHCSKRAKCIKSPIPTWSRHLSSAFRRTCSYAISGMCKRLLLESQRHCCGERCGDAESSQNGVSPTSSRMSALPIWANYNRINTTGWHLYTLASSARQIVLRRGVFVGMLPLHLGSNLPSGITAHQAVNAGTGAKTFRMFFELAGGLIRTWIYAGPIYSAVVNATWQVSYTNQPEFLCSERALIQRLRRSSHRRGNRRFLSAVTVKCIRFIWINCLSRLNGQPILPYFRPSYRLSVARIPSVQGLTVGRISPSNIRTPYILSVTALYDNGGQQNAGTDINYIGIQAANLVFLLQGRSAGNLTQNAQHHWRGFATQAPIAWKPRMSPINTTGGWHIAVVIKSERWFNAPANVMIGWEMLAVINSVAGGIVATGQLVRDGSPASALSGVTVTARWIVIPDPIREWKDHARRRLG